MEISPTATYPVDRTGQDGRDLAVVFEGPKAGGAIMVAPPTPADPTARTSPAGEHDGEDKLSLDQAIANAAAIAAPDPITALSSPAAVAAPASSSPVPRQGQDSPTPLPSPAASAAQAQNPPAAPPAQNPPAAPPAQNPPAAPPAQNPPTAPQPQVYSSDVPGTGQKL